MNIFDNHLHLSPRGQGWKAIQEFEKRGGTHAMVAHLPHPEAPVVDTGDFTAQYAITLSLAKEARQKTGVGILVSLGPYPVELLRLEAVLGKEKAIVKMKEGIKDAVMLISAGEAHALGEIGRPHFPVEQWAWDASNEILEYGMALASEAGCPVIVHCEGATDQTWKDLAQMADKTGLPREKVVKHYSSPAISEKENLGIFPSVLASKDAVRKAFSQGARFMMETDFIDDPDRPGAVLAPTTVPKRTKWVLEEGLASDMDMDIVHRKNPEKMYGLEMV